LHRRRRQRRRRSGRGRLATGDRQRSSGRRERPRLAPFVLIVLACPRCELCRSGHPLRGIGATVVPYVAQPESGAAKRSARSRPATSVCGACPPATVPPSTFGARRIVHAPSSMCSAAHGWVGARRRALAVRSATPPLVEAGRPAPAVLT